MENEKNCSEASTGTVRRSPLRIAATSDIHCKRVSRGEFRPFFEQMADAADVLVFCGDITHFGLPEEAEVFIDEISPILGRNPVLSVLGNHDFEAGKERELWAILSGAGVIMLDGNCYTVDGVGFTGIKGFGGGFGKRALQPWGEDAIKNFVKESLAEANKLDLALSKLEGVRHRVAILHYAPITGTVEGEPPEIYPFLGSSHLEAPLDRHGAAAAFHGHAHKGAIFGKTEAGVPVYNVSMESLRRGFPGRPPFLITEIPAGNGLSG